MSLVNSTFHKFALFWSNKRILEKLHLFYHVPNLVQFFYNDDDLMHFFKHDFNFINSHSTIIDSLIKYTIDIINRDQLKKFILELQPTFLTAFGDCFKKTDCLLFLLKLLMKDESLAFGSLQKYKDFKLAKRSTFTKPSENYDYAKYNIPYIPTCDQIIKRCVKYQITPDSLRLRLNIIKNFRSIKKHKIKQFIVLDVPHLQFIQKKNANFMWWMYLPHQWRWAKFLPFEEFKSRLSFVFDLKKTSPLYISFFDYVWSHDQCAGHYLIFDSKTTSKVISQRSIISNPTNVQHNRNMFLKSLITFNNDK